MANKFQLAVGLDIGSAWTRVVVLAVDGGCLRFLGNSAVISHGWHRGQIADQSAVADSVRQAVQEAEARSQQQIGSAVLGVGGPSVRSQQGRGLYEFGHRRPIDRGDLVYAIDLAARARLDEDRLLLQVLPQDFTVDGRPPIPHPLNLECQRLEAHALLVTASAQEHQALISAVHQAHLRVEETVFEAMAAAYASVLSDERSGGVALVDIGAHSTNVCVYDGDSMLFAAGLPVSGDHFTRDLGELKALSFEEAERLKFAHGCALVGLTADNIVIELPPEPGRPGREINRRELIEILEARAAQIFDLVDKCRVRYARDIALREGIVLCGGGAQLEGMVELAEKVLGCPARLGFPRGVIDFPEELMSPVWTICAGLAMYSARLQARRERGGGPSIWSLFTGK
ncbi:MAG: cell division protein FtsA [Acidobacteria bacterium]|nr:cell division protein FtsA [Acidobacteriota bacterium]